VPMDSQSLVEVSPPAPNWMLSSGLGFRPALWTASIRRSRSGVGWDRKPVEISMTSKLGKAGLVGGRMREGGDRRGGCCSIGSAGVDS